MVVLALIAQAVGAVVTAETCGYDSSSCRCGGSSSSSSSERGTNIAILPFYGWIHREAPRAGVTVWRATIIAL